MTINENSLQMYLYAFVCINMEPYAAICIKNAWFNTSHVATNMENIKITEMQFLPMGWMQNFDANPMAHNKSSQIPYMIKTNIQKKRSAAEAEPINWWLVYGGVETVSVAAFLLDWPAQCGEMQMWWNAKLRSLRSCVLGGKVVGVLSPTKSWVLSCKA